MEVEIKTTDIKQTNFLTKIILVLFGIFITSSIFAIFLKAFETHGIWMAAVLCLILFGTGLYFTNKGNRLRTILWTMLVFVILGAIAYFVGIELISKSLEGI